MARDGFPDVRWGRDRPMLKKPLDAFASSRFGSWCIRKMTPIDRKLLNRSNGRLTIFGPIGVPLLLLTTTGRKSGQPHTTPLTYMCEDDRLFLVGSNFGQRHHPAWSWNLLANHDAAVLMGGIEIPVAATMLTGAERERIFDKFVEYTRTYTEYTNRTTRDLRVFALDRR
ncbi:nitroreductase family deazaflavin-dependent oxidoreductase [Rhodococcus sp. ARC_M6]|nr:nitroreductase family deazaflavin-dependent oxidoreductase [Rhodococcus sp. ARC_M6]